MSKTIELIQQAGFEEDPMDRMLLEKLIELVRANERARLLAVAGEPCAWAYHTKSGLIDIITDEEHTREPGDYNVPMFNGDQVAAAVLRETERCAKVCEDDFGNGALNLADAIRARGE